MRRARIRTTHGTPATAAIVADAVTPDNTDSMTTYTDGAAVETTIERETTGGLHSSVDDYVVNVTVADRLAGEDGSIRRDTETTATGHALGDIDDTDATDATDAIDAQPDDYTENTDTTHE